MPNEINLQSYYGYDFSHPFGPAIAFQFVCGSDLASRAIAWYGTGYGGYSHVDAIIMHDSPVFREEKAGWLIGARADQIGSIPPGVQMRPPAYEKVIRRCVAVLPCTENEQMAADQFIESQLRKAYDKTSIWGFLLGRPWHSKGHWICSALQTQRLRMAGRIGSLPEPDSQITPNSLLLILAAMRARITVLSP